MQPSVTVVFWRRGARQAAPLLAPLREVHFLVLCVVSIIRFVISVRYLFQFLKLIEREFLTESQQNNRRTQPGATWLDVLLPPDRGTRRVAGT